MNHMLAWIGLLGTILAIITSVSGMVALYRGSVIKGYAAQRDYEHLKNNHKQLVTNIEFMAKDIDAQFQQVHQTQDNRFDRVDKDLIELKALMLANLRSKPLHEND